MDQEQQNRILATLHAILFILLITLSALTLRGVVEQFFSEDTTFKIYDGEINEYPTITICTPKSKLEYGVDVNIAIKLHDWVYSIDKGENIWLGTNESYEENIKLEQFYSYIISGFCYKITRNMSHAIRTFTDGFATITLNWKESITYNELPDLDIYLTSKNNFLGAIYYEWMEGEELHFKISKVSTISCIYINHTCNDANVLKRMFGLSTMLG